MKKILILLAAITLSCNCHAQQSIQEQLAEKDKQIQALKKQLSEQQARMRLLEEANLMPAVIFEKNSAVVENSQLDAIEMIATYIKSNPSASVEVRAFASFDESNTERLCLDRANNVIAKLITVYRVRPTQLKAAVFGATDRLYEATEFNRICTFNDSNRKRR